MNKKYIVVSLILLTAISLFLHVFRFNSSPPGFNADEASYGYTAYSLLKTGADEFGNRFPLLRLQSFGDFKLPLYTYLAMPFIALLGLMEASVRLPALLAALSLPIVMYLTVLELFKRPRAALIAAALVAFSPWLNMLSRHAHEVVPASLFILLSWLFFIRFTARTKHALRDGLLFVLFISAALYTYHIARMFFAFFAVALLFEAWRHHIKKKKIILIFSALCLFTVPFLIAEFNTPPSRLANLFITKNEGIVLKSNELRTEFAPDPFGTPLFITVDEVVRRYVSYFSPEFMLYRGDANPRFGFEGMGPVNLIEYALFITGLFFAFSRKNKHMIFPLVLLFISPLPGSLTWQEYAMTRAYFMIIPFIMVAAMGADSLLESRNRFKMPVAILVTLLFFMLTAKTWFFFFFHYPHRATVVRAWLAGYAEMAHVVKENYAQYDTIYITRDVGQPYIFLLFYLKYPPEQFAQTLKTTPPDEYGYTQITGFDKFVFSTQNYEQNKDNKKALYLFSQSEGQGRTIDPTRIEKITKGTEEMFWVVKP